MTDLSGITVTPGILPAQLRESLTKAIERIGAKMADTVRIDTTHFVTTEGRGIAWETAVEKNVPVVRPEWVEGCEAGGRIVGVRQYYLDADPRQRQIIQAEVPQAAPESGKESPLPNVPAAGANGSNQAVPPIPPAKDAQKEDEESSDEDEEEDEKRDLPNEQKVRVEDRDQQKVALRPAEPKAELEDEEEEEEEEEVKGKGKEAEEGSGSGTQTPGHSSFQDIAL